MRVKAMTLRQGGRPASMGASVERSVGASNLPPPPPPPDSLGLAKAVLSGHEIMRSGRVLALCLSLFAANAAAQSTTDYDDDNDNLIDIRTLAQLNAIRYDLDGNGTVSSSDAANYTAAFTNRATGMGCAATCTGYELRQNLNFDTDGDEDVDSSDTGSYPNWSPIGGTYTATFEGNGFTISHLTIVNAPGSAGLFNEVSGTVRNLGVADANVSGVGGSLTQIGALAGEIAGGTVIASWASGQVRVGPGSTSRPRVGGLV